MLPLVAIAGPPSTAGSAPFATAALQVVVDDVLLDVGAGLLVVDVEQREELATSEKADFPDFGRIEGPTGRFPAAKGGVNVPRIGSESEFSNEITKKNPRRRPTGHGQRQFLTFVHRVGAGSLVDELDRLARESS